MSNTGKGVYVTNGKVNHRLLTEELAQNYIIQNPGFRRGQTKFKPVSDSTRELHRVQMLGNTNNTKSKHKKARKRTQAEKDHLSKINKGKKSSLETRLKISRSQKGRVSGMKGKHHKESTKRLLSELNKGELNHFYGKHHSEKTKLLISKSLAEYALDHDCKFISDPELEIANYLSKYFKVTKQFLIEQSNSCHRFDILVELPNTNLLIEFDGSYWHRNQDYDNDERKLLALSYGYSYLVIREHEYYSKGRLKFAKSEVAKFYPELLNYHLSDVSKVIQ